jgi:hypothetical protein
MTERASSQSGVRRCRLRRCLQEWKRGRVGARYASGDTTPAFILGRFVVESTSRHAFEPSPAGQRTTFVEKRLYPRSLSPKISLGSNRRTDRPARSHGFVFLWQRTGERQGCERSNPAMQWELHESMVSFQQQLMTEPHQRGRNALLRFAGFNPWVAELLSDPPVRLAGFSRLDDVCVFLVQNPQSQPHRSAPTSA